MRLEGRNVGQHRLLQLIASGNKGEVYLVEDSTGEEHLAAKIVYCPVVPHNNEARSKEAPDPFPCEGKAIAQLEHPHILPLLAFGKEQIGTLSLNYTVMPYCQEGSFSRCLHQRPGHEQLSLQQLSLLLEQAASGLQYAHDHSIIHQNVKPTNFFVRHGKDWLDTPQLLLADFSLAAMCPASSLAAATLRGTATYMAPEQWEGRPVYATDQYALAVMVYQILVGHPPFQGGLEQVMAMHLQHQPPLPSLVNPRIPASVGDVLMRALAKDPEARFPSVSAFSSAFLQAVEELSAVHLVSEQSTHEPVDSSIEAPLPPTTQEP